MLRQRRRMIAERLAAVEGDIRSIFSKESFSEIIDTCGVLWNLLRFYHTEDKASELFSSASKASSILVDDTGRKLLDLCIEAIIGLENGRFDRSEIKFAVEKLVLDTKFKVVKLCVQTISYCD